MVEVFKTNVTDPVKARWLVNQIHQTYKEYTANFDLQDCDRILRVKSEREVVEPGRLIALLKAAGCEAEVLQEEEPLRLWVQTKVNLRYLGSLVENN